MSCTPETRLQRARSPVSRILYVVEHMSKELRPATVMADVAAEGIRVIKAVYPIIIAQGALEKQLDEAFLGTPSRIILHAGRRGVIKAIDIGSLVDLAIRTSCTIEVVPQVGDFGTSNDPVFRLYGDGAAVTSKELLGHIGLEPERTLERDPAFAFRIVVDIASKALSPAINDPTTAVLALDQIHNLLREVGRRRLNAWLVLDSTGYPRLVYRTPDWEDFVALAVTEIRQFGANSTQVARRMRAMLEKLIPLLLPDRSSVLRQELLKSTVDQGFVMAQDKMGADLPDFQGLGGHRKTA
jgi:uncharacterized membrane protein